MRKIIIIIGICFLFASLPITSGLTISDVRNTKSIIREDSLTDLTTDDPPEWATHVFIGVLGVTNEMGKPQAPASIITGYCQQDFKGKVAGVIAIREGEENIPKGYFTGHIIGPFMLGILGNITTEKETLIVGLGVRNETHFYFRVMTVVGPTFYIAGKYMPIGLNRNTDLLTHLKNYVK